MNMVTTVSDDILTHLNYVDFYDTHASRNDTFTISSYLREQLVDYIVLEAENGHLLALHEKPRRPFEVSKGVYVVSRRALDYVPHGSAHGFDHLMHDLVAPFERVAV